MRAVLLALVLGACAASAPADPMAPLQPLMGCWRGVFPDQPDIHDERCFEALGPHVVDRHYVRPTTYGGDTTYHYDDAQNEVIWAYAANDGGRSNGVVTAWRCACVSATHVLQRGRDGDAFAFYVDVRRARSLFCVFRAIGEWRLGCVDAHRLRTRSIRS